MVHPAARPINSQLLNTHEKESLRTSIEVMVLFDIRLTEAPSSSQPGAPATDAAAYASFSPDIAKLVIFESSRMTRRLPMQLRTQTQILREYEPIKQAMLTGGGAVEERQIEPTPTKQQAQQRGIMSTGIFSILSQPVRKKRTLAEAAGADAAGKFTYKFKEGHSKNFKRELTIDFFLGNPADQGEQQSTN